MRLLLKITISIFLYLVLITILQSCRKKTLPEVTTANASEITKTTAVSGGNVTNNGGAEVTARGVCWGTTQNPSVSLNKTSDGSGNGTFISSITGLNGNTLYHVRAYATNSEGTQYGNDISFTTDQKEPTLTTTPVSTITTTSAISGGNITSDGGGPVSARGVCWSTLTGPTVALSTKTTNGSGTGSFTSNITGLLPGRTYYVRAYAINSAGTGYGNELLFITIAEPPTLSGTTLPINITCTTATSGGYITTDGGSPVTARGVCWATTPNPTISSSITSNGTGTGSFTSSLTNLLTNTTYHVRAYATNSKGTSYGADVTFTTLSCPNLYVSSLTISPTTLLIGSNLSFQATVYASSAVTGCSVGFYLSKSNSTLEVTDRLFYETTLAFNGSYSFSAGYVFSISTMPTPGDYYVLCFVDNKHTIDESNESDNIRASVKLTVP